MTDESIVIDRWSSSARVQFKQIASSQNTLLAMTPGLPVIANRRSVAVWQSIYKRPRMKYLTDKSSYILFTPISFQHFSTGLLVVFRYYSRWDNDQTGHSDNPPINQTVWKSFGAYSST